MYVTIETTVDSGWTAFGSHIFDGFGYTYTGKNITIANTITKLYRLYRELTDQEYSILASRLDADPLLTCWNIG